MLQHPRDLEGALFRRGWRVIEALPGDGYRIAASWKVQHAPGEQTAILDFAAIDKSGNFCHPLERA